MGMFGSIGRVLGGLDDPGKDGTSFADRLSAAAMMLSNDPNGMALGAKLLGDKRAAAQKLATRGAFEKKLQDMIGPKFENAPDPTVTLPTMIGHGRPGSLIGQDQVGPRGPTPPPEAMVLNPGAGGDGMNIPQPQFEGGGIDVGSVMPRRVSDGLSINSPELPGLVLEASRAGYDMGDILGVLKAQKADAPAHIEGNDGIYERQPDGGWKRVVAYPPRETVSPGWRPRADGQGWEPVKGGPYDPDYIRSTSGIRRDAVVARPMPRVGGGGKGRAAPKPRSYGANDVTW